MPGFISSNLLIILLLFICLSGIMLIYYTVRAWTAAILNDPIHFVSLGSGKTLFKAIDKNGTEWKLNIIPVLGEIRFRDVSIRTYSILAKRLISAAAGSAALFILSFAITFFIYFLFGYHSLKPIVGHVSPNSPAFQAGVKAGDQFTKVDGQKISEYWQLKNAIEINGSKPLSIEILRDNEKLSVTLRPQTIKDAPVGTVLIGVSPAYKRSSIKVTTVGIQEAAELAGKLVTSAVISTSGYVKEKLWGINIPKQIYFPVFIYQSDNGSYYSFVFMFITFAIFFTMMGFVYSILTPAFIVIAVVWSAFTDPFNRLIKFPRKQEKSHQAVSSDQSVQSAKKILIPQPALTSDEIHALIQSNVNFVNHMLDKGAYLPSELPQNAMRSYYVDYYHGQVSNGGHGQFVGNSGWNSTVVKYISEGLAAIQQDPYGRIFEDLCLLINSDSKRAKSIADGGGFGEIDPAISELDKRFFAQDSYEVLSSAHTNWLKSLPELQTVHQDEYLQSLQYLCEINPLRPERLALNKKDYLTNTLSNPMLVASRLLGVGIGSLPVKIGAGDPSAIAPDGRKGTAWAVQAGNDRKDMFIFEGEAILCDIYLQDGKRLTNEIIQKQQELLLSGTLDEMIDLAKVSRKEIARVSTSDIQNAINAASKLLK